MVVVVSSRRGVGRSVEQRDPRRTLASDPMARFYTRGGDGRSCRLGGSLADYDTVPHLSEFQATARCMGN